MRQQYHISILIAVLALQTLLLRAQQPVCKSAINNKPVDATSARSQEVDVLFVPVIVHVVYANEEQNISAQQIYKQLQLLNQDFRRLNEDAVHTLDVFQDVAADSKIEFFLAEGESISRTPTTHGPFGNDDLHFTDNGGKDVADPERHLNIWIADLGEGTLGYGASPGGESFKDGVAIDFRHFGFSNSEDEPYHQGRTLTHEVGHWLGLIHPWAMGGCDSDDGIGDTPIQSAPSSGCDLGMTSCGNLNMVQNFMNTSFDKCMNLFTIQQVARMRNVLVTQRSGTYTTEPITTAVEIAQHEKLKLYPTRVVAEPVVFVESIAQQQLMITDPTGRILYQGSIVTPDIHPISLDGWCNGLYIARFTNHEKTIFKKIYLHLNL